MHKLFCQRRWWPERVATVTAALRMGGRALLHGASATLVLGLAGGMAFAQEAAGVTLTAE